MKVSAHGIEASWMADALGEPRYRLLGPVSVQGELDLGAPKQRAVLAALLLTANRMVSEERLFALVWGSQTPRSVLGRLRVYVHELRTLLGKDVIERVGAGYRIRVEAGELDLATFDEQVALARSEGPVSAAARLRAALALWTGPALGGVTAALADREVPALEERRLSAFEELFEAELAAGRHDQVVGELRALAAELPLRERLQGQLMLALHRSERRSEALNVYLETRQLLVDELGIEPGQALQQIHQEILEPSAPEVAAARPAELPRDTRGFAGREAELARLDDLLTAGDGVCVISGTAGVGKSALAVHWAHLARDHFPDGQLYINLRGFDPHHEPLTPVAALGQLLSSLGVSPRSIPDGLDQQAGLFRSLLADRKVLVLLDNANSAAQVLPLLPASGAVLVTSRHRLSDLVAETGAIPLSLSGLSDVDSDALLAGVLGADRVAAEAVACAELAQLCGGLPLALRIAAANIAGSGAGVTGMVAELARGDRLAGLAVDGASDSAVTVAFAVSYRALQPRERHVFRLLGLVPGLDFTVLAAAAVAGISVTDAAKSLKALASVHLVEQHTADRYRFHDLVRLYAADKARTDPDHSQAWNRLTSHYLAIAHAASKQYQDPARLPGGFHIPTASPAAVPEELPNLTAAMLQMTGRGPFPAVWRLADDLRVLYRWTGQSLAWLEIAPLALEAARHKGEREVQAMLHHSVGEGLFRSGKREQAIHHMNSAARIARDCGWRECEAATLVDLSFALEYSGRLAESIENNQKAAALFAEIGSVSGEARTLDALGNQYHHLGKLRLAEDCCRQALDISRRYGMLHLMGISMRDLGAVLLDRGAHAEAEECLVEACEALTELGGLNLATAVIWLSRLRWETADYPAARAEAQRAAEIARSDGDRLVEAAALIAQGDAEIRMGSYAAATTHLTSADEMINKAGLRWHLAYNQCAHARLQAGLGNLDQAIAHATKARDVARQGGYRPPELAALSELAAIQAMAGQLELAASTARDALELCDEMGHAPCEDRLQPLIAAG